MIDIFRFHKTLKLSWFKRLLKNGDQGWKTIVKRGVDCQVMRSTGRHINPKDIHKIKKPFLEGSPHKAGICS